MTLNLGDGMTLPDDAVTQTFAIVAMRGRGKTNTAVVIAEEMIGNALPVVIIDPTGVWWGLRSSATGKGDGLPVVILGGDHGDVPLEAAAGALIADTVVASRAPMVLDLSGLSKSAGRRFVTDFAETLYRRNREPLHVIIDEADLYAPQRAQGDTLRSLGAIEDLVRRGRAHGLGVTLITQRPAVIAKDVLTQAEALIVLGMTGPRDVAAVDEWVRLHATDDDARTVKASLPGLPIGTAWVWSPGWLDVLRKVRVRKRTTFDSSATPKPGQKRATPSLAPVDVAALGEKMRAMAEEHAANDPTALRAELRRATATIASLRAAAAAPPPPPVIVPAVPDQVRAGLAELPQKIEAAQAQMQAALDRLTEHANRLAQNVPAMTEAAVATATAPVPAKAPWQAHTGPLTRAQPATPAPAGDVALGKAHRSILTVLTTYGTLPASSLAILTGYSAKGGGFRNALSALRTAGYIEGGQNAITVTPAGQAAAPPSDPLPTGPALREHWKTHTSMGKAHRVILDALADAHGQPITTTALADTTGYEPGGGGFRNALSRLRTLGLIHNAGTGSVRIDTDLL